VIPAFQLAREEALLRDLARARPDLKAALAEAVRRAAAERGSPVSELLARGTLGEGERRGLLAAQRARAGRAPDRWGAYAVFEEIGRGGHGTVFRARRRDHRADCALKVLTGGAEGRRALERFRREAAVLARLEHPGIVRLLDAGEVEGVRFHATEHVPGGSLAALVARRGPLPAAQAVPLAAAAARALASAHAAGVVHRDLRPENLLLDARGRPRVVDFGLAKDAQARGTLTRTRAFLGTTSYAAPEQMAFAKQADARADVFGLAAVLHFLLTGAPPYAGDDLDALFTSLERGFEPIAPRPGLEGPTLEALNVLLERALATSADARHPDMATLAAELDAIG